ncbi:MAG: hypothetical protein M8319_05795, partial [Nitrosopumilus sp.]|nr:hypothetical protein [Nitrosopumilus sp.]
LRKKIESNSTSLKDLNLKIYIGLLNGYNDAFVIDTKTKNELIKQNPKSSEIIQQMLRGRDVGKYYLNWQDTWLINSHNGIKNKFSRVDVPKDFPAVYNHLLQFKEPLKIRYNQGSHWTNLRNCIYFNEFKKPKIIWGELSDLPKFAYDDKGFVPEATLFAMIGDDLKYLLGILNSKIALWYFEQISTSSGMGTNRWKKYKIEQLPIKNSNEKKMNEIISVVDKIIAITNSNNYLSNPEKQSQIFQLEQSVDKLVYNLYDLSLEEIEIIENALN